MKKLNLAIIGQGRSGRDIHGAYLKSERNEFYNVKYVVDFDVNRCKRAEEEYPNCKAFTDYRKLFDFKDIDLVVNASYSEMHYEIAKDIMQHGYNVLVEKPICRNRYEIDDLILTAKQNNVLFAVFMQTLGAPYYIKAKEVMESQILGKIEQISVRFNRFGRRWDWQTLQKKMAGNAYNTGPHPIGVAYGLLDFDENAKLVYSKISNNALVSGDAENYVKMIIDTPNKPVVDVEINDTDAYSIYNIKIQGSKGCFKAKSSSYQMKYIIDNENPERPVIEESLQDKDGYPIYCSENLITHEEEGTFDGTAFDIGTSEIYKSVYYKLTENKPLIVTPEQASIVVSAIEQLHAENPLPRRF